MDGEVVSELGDRGLRISVSMTRMMSSRTTFGQGCGKVCILPGLQLYMPGQLSHLLPPVPVEVLT